MGVRHRRGWEIPIIIIFTFRRGLPGNFIIPLGIIAGEATNHPNFVGPSLLQGHTALHTFDSDIVSQGLNIVIFTYCIDGGKEGCCLVTLLFLGASQEEAREATNRPNDDAYALPRNIADDRVSQPSINTNVHRCLMTPFIESKTERANLLSSLPDSSALAYNYDLAWVNHKRS